jgi:multidrug efflux system membrane fusion protein
VVPLASVVRPANSQSYAVFVVENHAGKQVARLRQVKLGEALGNMIALTEGVREGEQVVVTGATLVSDGEQVRVIPR